MMFKEICILSLALGAAVARLGSTTDDCANAAWDQCGGQDFTGDTCCPAGYKCVYDNDYYSGCSLEDLCLVVQYGQCGGMADGQPWPEDQACCPDGFECQYQSEYYSQCVDAGSNSTGCAEPYGQCGGDASYNGTTCCSPGYECTPDPVNPEYYSGCTLIPVCQNAFYGQCDGTDSDGNPWTEKHTTCCPDGFECTYQSDYFSQCCPEEGGCQ